MTHLQRAAEGFQSTVTAFATDEARKREEEVVAQAERDAAAHSYIDAEGRLNFPPDPGLGDRVARAGARVVAVAGLSARAPRRWLRRCGR